MICLRCKLSQSMPRTNTLWLLLWIIHGAFTIFLLVYAWHRYDLSILPLLPVSELWKSALYFVFVHLIDLKCQTDCTYYVPLMESSHRIHDAIKKSDMCCMKYFFILVCWWWRAKQGGFILFSFSVVKKLEGRKNGVIVPSVQAHKTWWFHIGRNKVLRGESIYISENVN